MAATIATAAGVSAGLAGGISSALNLTSAQVIKAAPGVCVKLVCIATGNLTLNDTTTTGGAAASNEFYTVTSATAGSVVELNWPCAAGIVASVATGTWAIAFG